MIRTIGDRYFLILPFLLLAVLGCQPSAVEPVGENNGSGASIDADKNSDPNIDSSPSPVVEVTSEQLLAPCSPEGDVPVVWVRVVGGISILWCS